MSGFPKRTSMYSPKIDEALIPRLYRLRKLKKIPMTRLVNVILEKAVSELEREDLENITHIDREYSDEKSTRNLP